MLFLVLMVLTGLLIGLLIGWLITIKTRRRLKHSVHFFQALVRQIPAGLFYQDLDDKTFVFASNNLSVSLNLKSPVKWANILKAFSEETSAILNQAYEKLHQNGEGFCLFLSTNTATHFIITGTLIHTPQKNGLLVAFQNVSDLASQLHLVNLLEQHKNILATAMDTLEFPLFIRDANGMTFFANHAVNQEKIDTLNDLSWLSLPFHVNDSFYTLTYGQETKTEEELNRILANMLTAQRRLCQQLPCATCLFNASGQLLACSDAFATLWHLDSKWIQSEPSYEDYWDTIQDNGLLSRVADFADYKKQQRENFACLSDIREIFLYLPDGKIIRRTMIPYIQGCVILLDEDQTYTKK